MCTDDFYEGISVLCLCSTINKVFWLETGQARLDGAFCEYSKEQKLAYLLKLKQAGVVNIEMESAAFTALTNHAGYRSAVICVSLVDRLNEDQVSLFFF